MSDALYGYKMKTIDGGSRALADYRGKALLVVNTASQCGYTPQYAGLETLYETYGNRGFAVLAFPANNFGSQEPGTDEEIRKFCAWNFNKFLIDANGKTVARFESGVEPLSPELTSKLEAILPAA